MPGPKEKFTVDFFPHTTVPSDTVLILQSKYHSEGYTAWFKLLELLGKSKYHYYDCRTINKWSLLVTNMDIPEKKLLSIFGTMAELGAINAYLWSNKILWSFEFVDSVKVVYERRRTWLLTYPQLCQHLLIKCDDERYYCKHDVDNDSINVDTNSIIVDINSHSRVEKSIVEESIEEKSVKHARTFEEFSIEMKNSRTIIESVSRDYKIELPVAEKYMDDFLKIRKSKEDWNFKPVNGADVPKSLKDNKSHFYSWVGSQIAKVVSTEIPKPVMFKPNRIKE